MQKEIAKINKNTTEEIIVQLTNFKGCDLLDLRIWIKPLMGETGKPTQKGLSVKLDILPELIGALKKAALAYKEAHRGGLAAVNARRANRPVGRFEVRGRLTLPLEGL